MAFSRRENDMKSLECLLFDHNRYEWSHRNGIASTMIAALLSEPVDVTSMWLPRASQMRLEASVGGESR